MVSHHQISIILLSYNDPRIERAIKSIRIFDDLNIAKILVIDGGSTNETTDLISQNLSSEDVLVSEPDRGIFDALNKGLDLCQTEYIGWLGSDDFFTGDVLSSDVVAALEKNDLFVANLHYFHDGYVTRITHSAPAKIGLVKYGLNNPHFATFGRAKLLKSERFELGLRGSDIDYFLKIFEKQPRVVTTGHVATLQEEGGYSNKTQTGIIRTNLELIPLYARYTNWLAGPVLVILKLIFKLLLKFYYKIFRVPLSIND